MIVRINGSVLNPPCAHPLATLEKEVLVNQWIEAGKKVEKLFKNYLVPTSVVLSVINLASPVLAVVSPVPTLTIRFDVPTGLPTVFVNVGTDETTAKTGDAKLITLKTTEVGTK